MILTITEILWGIDAILALVCGARIYQGYKRTNDKMVGDFAKFFIFFGVGFVAATVADPVIENIFFIKLLITIALIAIFLGMAYLAKLTVALTYPRLEWKVFWLAILANVATVAANVKYYLLSPYHSPFLDSETGIFVVNFPVVVSFLLTLAIVGLMIVPGIIFIRKAIRVEDGTVKTRGTLLGLGIILFAVGAMACGAGKAVLPMQISHLFIAVGYLPFLAGLFYVVEKKLPKAIPSIQSAPAITPPIKW